MHDRLSSRSCRALPNGTHMNASRSTIPIPSVPESTIYRPDLRPSFIHTLRDIRRITWRAAKQSVFSRLDPSPLPNNHRRGLRPLNPPLSLGVSHWPMEPPRCCVLFFAEAV